MRKATSPMSRSHEACAGQRKRGAVTAHQEKNILTAAEVNQVKWVGYKCHSNLEAQSYFVTDPREFEAVVFESSACEQPGRHVRAMYDLCTCIDILIQQEIHTCMQEQHKHRSDLWFAISLADFVVSGREARAE
jgi:hypothetical protein